MSNKIGLLRCKRYFFPLLNTSSGYDRHRAGTGTGEVQQVQALGRYRVGTGQVQALGRYRAGTGQVQALGRYRVGTGQVQGKYRASTGQVQGRQGHWGGTG